MTIIPMTPFQEKIGLACAKKLALFEESLPRYAIRSMLAGVYLTMSTAVGAIAADIIGSQFPALSRFAFAFIFAIGLVYVLIFNGELATSNMMYLTSGVYYKQLHWAKAIKILLFCTFFNFIGALLIAYLFAQSFSFSLLKENSFLISAVETKLAKTDWMNFTEGITANIFVNVAILGYMTLKDDMAKITIALSAIFMFVFLVNEHLVANFASFMLAGFSPIKNINGFTVFQILRQWVLVFIGNLIGGGILIGITYSYLNQSKTKHVDM